MSFEISHIEDTTAAPIATTIYDIIINDPDCPLISSLKEVGESVVEVYPNPTFDNINIKSEQNIKCAYVFSAQDQFFEEIDIFGNNIVDLSHLPSGLYYLEMENGEIDWAKVYRI